MSADYSVAVVTNDIYTKEDAEALVRMQALPSERIVGVETGGCPHTAIREDATINLQAIAGLNARFPDLDLVFIESGGDNLAATFRPILPISPSMSFPSARVRKFRARAGRALPAPICWSSTRRTSPLCRR